MSHVWRCRPTRTVASAGVAALLAALAASHALAQQNGLPPADTLLRSSVDDNEDTPRRDRNRPTRPGSDRANVGDRPGLTGHPPAFGAGTTGFDSTNGRKRRSRPSFTKQAPTGIAATPPPPLSITPGAVQRPVSIVPGTSTTATTTLSSTSSATKTTTSGSTNTGTAASSATTPGSSAAADPATTGTTLLRGTTVRPSQLVRVPTGNGADSETMVVNTASLSPTQATILRRRTSPEEDAFAAIGARYGAFTFLPAVDVTGGYDTNPARVPGGSASSFVVVAPELVARSDWERHELTATLRGSYTTYQQTPELDRPTFDGKITGRVDVTRNTRLNLEAIAVVGTDNPGSPNVQAGLSRFPVFTTLGGTFGITQRFNRLEVNAKGLYDRTEYQDSHFTDGTTDSNADRDFNHYGGTMRVAYDVTPGLKPFVEGGWDTRVHDIAVDRFGLRRDSDGWYVKSGTTFEFSRKLTGEVSIGWLNRSYKDPTLNELNGFTVDGSLIYAMSALTNVKFNASTVAAETTVPGTAGVLTRNAGVEVEHSFRRWLIGSLKFNYGFDDYVGSPRQDDRFSVSGSITYKLNRMMQLKAEIREEWLRSTTPVGVNYDATVYLLGMRLQR
jgi:hypothetical protein